MTIIGIDPGTGGGIAYFHPDGTIGAEKMPDTEGDVVARLRLLRGHDATPPTVWIEKVQPGGLAAGKAGRMGSKSAFTFGRGVGVLHAACIALGFSIRQVRPQEWQSAMGCLTHGDKRISKAEAQRRWPHMKVTHAIADALLIAEYGRTRT